MTMFGYQAAISTMEEGLVARLQLEELAPAGEEIPMEGSWKGQPARLSYRRWRGPKVAIARTVRLLGHELEIANLVAVARPPLDAPILGIDLIAARPDAGLVVADLS
ncbi:MAG TPA: hypothetical protein VNT81_22800, partial [Vicinamibacterales bacterium]|nr:hypothetical protein [Vicinamibacterales bacterium]